MWPIEKLKRFSSHFFETISADPFSSVVIESELLKPTTRYPHTSRRRLRLWPEAELPHSTYNQQPLASARRTTMYIP
jgi:hypothetical protein